MNVSLSSWFNKQKDFRKYMFIALFQIGITVILWCNSLIHYDSNDDYYLNELANKVEVINNSYEERLKSD